MAIQKKICLLGAFAVGKTSLIQRYVNSLFSDKYHTTVGVKIDKKQVICDEQTYTLMIWDIAGEDDFYSIRPAHLRGTTACIIVIDGTRQNSYSVALELFERVQEHLGRLPVVFALNKADLQDEWVLEREQRQLLEQLGCPVLATSAKLDQGVDRLFEQLVEQFTPKKEEL